MRLYFNITFIPLFKLISGFSFAKDKIEMQYTTTSNPSKNKNCNS